MKPLTRALTYNWPLKLTSLGLAVLLWLLVLVKTNPWTVRQFDAPVEEWHVPKGLQALSITPATVRVRLAGRRSRVSQVDPELLRVRAWLAGRSAGEHGDVPISVSTPTLPRGVAVLDTAINSVRVSLDRTVRQKRAVRIRTRGWPAPGFEPVSTQARPNEVTVVGPQSIVSGVTSVWAEVDISGIQEMEPSSCLLEARDARNMPLDGVMIDPPRADIEITFERVNTRSVPVDPNISSLPEGQEIQLVVVSPPVVTLTGSPSALAAVEYVRTEPIRLRSSTTGVRASLQIPEGLKAVRDDSVRVSVQLRGRSRPAAGGNASRPAPERPTEGDPEGRTPDDEEGPAPAEPDEPPTAEPQPPGPDDDNEPGGTPGEPGEPGEDEEPTPEPEQPDEDPTGPSE